MDCVDYECTGMDEPDAIGRPGEEDDCDEFEREMLAELDERVHRAEQDGGLRAGGSALLPSTTTTSRQKLLDSDDEEDDDGDERLPQPSNDELLFDPGADNEDQKWADKVRRSHHPKAASGVVKAPNSSAVLSCPACFIVVCIDCQQHWEYKHQFRAMFVMNCQVDTSSALKFPLSKKEQRKQAHLKKKKGNNEDAQISTADQEDEVFKAVKCVQCSTQVAVYDSEEIYHFYNVLASQS